MSDPFQFDGQGHWRGRRCWVCGSACHLALTVAVGPVVSGFRDWPLGAHAGGLDAAQAVDSLGDCRPKSARSAGDCGSFATAFLGATARIGAGNSLSSPQH